MKILSVVGSPRRNANTHFMAQKFCEVLQEMGVECEEAFLSKMDIAPCLDCGACIKDGVCQVEDDFGPLVESMKSADGLLLSTPVYCCSVTAQMKAYMDRCHSLCFPDWRDSTKDLRGKPVAVLVGAGYPPIQDETFVVEHKMHVDMFFRLVKEMKLSQSLPLVQNIDPMAPFDSTVDCLRTLYQFCIFMTMELVGYVDVVGLGHGRKAVRGRPHELERVVNLARNFFGMMKMIKEDAYF